MALQPHELVNQKDGVKYWQSVDADVDGMLGGFASISDADIEGSRLFLSKLGIGRKATRRSSAGMLDVLEGGAGIGRVTRGLLRGIATNIDIIEPTKKFADELEKQQITRNIFNVGLEAWSPAHGVVYDLIWIQWCASHLDDDQLAQFLVRSKPAIKEGGYIIFKENLSNTGVDIFDKLDSSVTREDIKFRTVFERAGFKIIKAEVQRGMPDELYPICTYALQPEL